MKARLVFECAGIKRIADYLPMFYLDTSRGGGEYPQSAEFHLQRSLLFPPVKISDCEFILIFKKKSSHSITNAQQYLKLHEIRNFFFDFL